jgi:hypothetical protein
VHGLQKETRRDPPPAIKKASGQACAVRRRGARKPSSGRRREIALWLVQDDAFERITRVVPRRPLQREGFVTVEGPGP